MGFVWVASNVRLPFGKTWRVIVYVRVEVGNTTWYYMDDSLDKVDVPNSVTFLNWTPIFECYVVRVGFKNGYKEDTCFFKKGLCTQNNISTILSSIIYITKWGLYDHLMSKRIFTLLMDKIFIQAPMFFF